MLSTPPGKLVVVRIAVVPLVMALVPISTPFEKKEMFPVGPVEIVAVKVTDWP